MGTITSGGVYTAPSSAGTHTVTATTTDSSQSGSATAYTTDYAGMFTYHDDNMRTGQNQSETVLTPANVNASSFGKLVLAPVGRLRVCGAALRRECLDPGRGTHKSSTSQPSTTASTRTTLTGASTTPLWKDSFIDPAHGITTVPAGDTGECCDIAPEIGITGTPVIDRSTNTLYVVAKTKEVVAGNTTYASASTPSTSRRARRSSVVPS